MIINTNTSALFAMRQHTEAFGGAGVSLQRLSTGMRINSARDDAAGLAITDRLYAQINGTRQGNRNLNEGISFLQTMEGGLASAAGILQRGREMAVRAANGSLSLSDRQSFQAELSQLLQEIDRIGSQTTYNGFKVFEDATLTTSTSSSSSTADPYLSTKQDILDNLQNSWLKQSEQLVADFYVLTADHTVPLTNVLDDSISANEPLAQLNASDPNNGRYDTLELRINVQGVAASGDNNEIDQAIAREVTRAVLFRTVDAEGMLARNETWFLEGAAQFLPGGDPVLKKVLGDVTPDAIVNNINQIGGAWGGDDTDYATAYLAVRYLDSQVKHVNINGQVIGGTNGDKVSGETPAVLAHLNGGGTLDSFFSANPALGYNSVNEFIADFENNGVTFLGGLDLNNDDTGAFNGPDDGGTRTTTWVGTVPDTSTSDPLVGFIEDFPAISGVYPDINGSSSSSGDISIQFGAGIGDSIELTRTALGQQKLGLDSVDLVERASAAITKFDRAIDAVSARRAEYGAALSRLESMVASNEVLIESLSATRSRIGDADFAQESASLARNQILSEASTAMVVQANAHPELVLSLLTPLPTSPASPTFGSRSTAAPVSFSSAQA